MRGSERVIEVPWVGEIFLVGCSVDLSFYPPGVIPWVTYEIVTKEQCLEMYWRSIPAYL